MSALKITPRLHNPERCRNESEVESKFIVCYLLPALGYPPESWHQEVTFGRFRLDFLAVADPKPRFRSQLQIVIEAKHPNQNLKRHRYQLREYLKELNIRYGVLTNGKALQVYEMQGLEMKLLLQIPGKKVASHIGELREAIGRNSLIKKALIRKPVKPLSFVQSTESKKRNTTQDLSKMKTIAIYHNKGGVGKTTTTINLAAALSKQGKRILLIDLDSQANTTFAMGLVKFQDELHDTIIDSYVYHVLRDKNKAKISEIVRTSDFCKEPIDVIPSHIDLMQQEDELKQLAPALTRLFYKLKEVEDSYDIVLIDTPPSLNLYAKIAIVTADYMLIPSDLKPFANEGLRNVRRFVSEIDEFREAMGGRPPIQLLGVLASKISTAYKFVEHTLPKMKEVVEAQYGFPLLNSHIFERRDISAAVERTIEVGDIDIPDPISVIDYKPRSPSAEEFKALGLEILSLI